MKWATRAGCHIDRTACAWLIKRFVDLEAEFVFVEDPTDVPDGATPFDMLGAELSHHKGDCSFETFLKHYLLEDPVLWEMARIVHEADLGDERYHAPEAPGPRCRHSRAIDGRRRRRGLGAHRPSVRRAV